MRDRTADLNTASVALSQLSYSPKISANLLIFWLFFRRENNEEVRIVESRHFSVKVTLAASGAICWPCQRKCV